MTLPSPISPGALQKAKSIAVLALLALAGWEIAAAGDLRLRDGRVYKNVTVLETSPTGIVIDYENGRALVDFSELPEGIKNQYGYRTENYHQASQSISKIHAANVEASRRLNEEQRKSMAETAQRKFASVNMQAANGHFIVAPTSSSREFRRVVIHQIRTGNLRTAVKEKINVDIEKREYPHQYLANQLSLFVIWFTLDPETEVGQATENLIRERFTQSSMIHHLLVAWWWPSKKT